MSTSNTQLRIVADQTADPTDPTTETTTTTIDDTAVADRRSLYEEAENIEPLDVSIDARAARFVDGVLEAVDRLNDIGGRPNIHRVDRLDPGATDDADLGELLVLPDETILFVGRDPTTKEHQTSPLYGYLIEPTEPLPAPRTAQEALSLLRPPDVQRIVDEDGEVPTRQGEWFLVPTGGTPVGSTFHPGVNERPYGPSPLGNHVPREYGFGVRDSLVLDRLHDRLDVPASVATIPEVIRWLDRQPDWSGENAPPRPGWEDLREAAEEVYVRGTLRHRQNEHYVENAGERWHRAYTHDIDVYTGDDVGVGAVRLD